MTTALERLAVFILLVATCLVDVACSGKGTPSADRRVAQDGGTPRSDARAADGGHDDELHGGPDCGDSGDGKDASSADAASDSDAATPDAGARHPALDALRAARRSLEAGWKFRPDPDRVGEAEGFASESYDDASWTEIEAGRTWEAQGFEGYDGIGWYRKRVTIPGEWSGSEVSFIAGGVDDEYDLFVNGRFVRHHGRPERTVYQARTATRVDPFVRFGEENLFVVRVHDWGGGGGLWRHVSIERSLSLDPYRADLPEPILPAHPEWITLYWRAWQMAFEKISFGNARNGFVEAYMDEGFNEQIYQWDTSFMVVFGKYGARIFPVMASLDNFYARQRADGYIQRVYSETDGQEVERPTEDEPVVNPPLFAWIERTYAHFSGDTRRLERVKRPLEKYFEWIERNLRKPPGRGLYFQTGLGCGMDNSPRGHVHHAAWIDMSSQQALAALELSRIAAMLGDDDARARWETRHAEISARVNELLWSESDGLYYDLDVDGHHSGVKHIGAFWPMLAEIASDAQVRRLVGHLRNPSEFWRPHVFPSLAASEPEFDPKGHYWRGAVWAPTNYMVIHGLALRGHRELAREAAENHLMRMSKVLAYSPPVDGIAPEERDDDAQTIWECYSSDDDRPGTRWDNEFYCRQDFVGWSGLGPIALLIEEVLGLEIVGAERKIVWHLQRTDAHGARRLPLEHALVDLSAEPRTSPEASVSIHATSTVPLTLELHRPGRPAAVVAVPAGDRRVVVD